MGKANRAVFSVGWDGVLAETKAPRADPAPEMESECLEGPKHQRGGKDRQQSPVAALEGSAGHLPAHLPSTSDRFHWHLRIYI